ncbi:MAG: glycoside hydrolase family 127 protein [Bacteroidaceae bacterium]|nr:glycoside hydrolase family 127 protein [Bacteroidaceae bacterium]
MKRLLFITTIALSMSTMITQQVMSQQAADYPITNVTFNHVRFNDRFWLPRIRQNQEVTIPIALKQCWDTGRIDNFKKAGGLMEGYFSTENPFDDSDVFKILEGLSYSLQNIPNKKLEAELDEIISYIAKAQEPDGYLYTARTAAEPGKLHPWVNVERWKNAPDLSHELYNMGHLYEAAAAHYVATGKRTLLNVALKNADLLVKDFLVGRLPYEPGHQIIESGLVKLYRITGKREYLDLSKYFLDLRGDRGIGRSEYSQTHLPVVRQTEAVGHAVRAAYMYCGIADVAAMTGNQDYINTINTIWDNVVEKKLYITGGIGAMSGGEAFGANYYLPNKNAYCETCAAIANVYWNWRMFLYHGDSKYYDVLERSLYNGVLSGISLSGDHFFYPNPLESNGGRRRSEWFGCACCPSNLCRFVASVGGYMYAHQDNKVYVNLYAQSTADIELGKEHITLRQETDYPWDGHIRLTVERAMKQNRPFTLMLRLPGWADNRPVPSDLYVYDNAKQKGTVRLMVNGVPVDYSMQAGYMAIERAWKRGDRVDFELPMDVHYVKSHENVVDDEGKVSVERGPIVYCMEQIDNTDRISDLILNPRQATAQTEWANELNGLIKLTLNSQHSTLNLIPYYAWCNRGDQGMKVWIPDNMNTQKGAMGIISINDTLKFHVEMEPRKDYSPKETVELPKRRILEFLGISDQELSAWMGSRVVYSAINPDGQADIESTATVPGHWFNSDGHTCGWAVSGCKIFSELHLDNRIYLSIGQFPNSCHPGDRFLIRQALTLRSRTDKEARRIVFEIDVTIHA